MTRISDEELERLKRDVSLERLVAAKGVKLERRGQDLHGRCPLHDDKTPSLVISPKKNLWHCLGACQSGGSVIDWVMKAEGVSFRHAVELLRAGHPSLAADTRRNRGRQKGAVPKQTSARKLAGELELAGDDPELLARVVDFYHRTLKLSPDALGYLERRGLQSAEMIEHFELGFSNRTLGYRLPARTRKRGAAMREQLARLGVLRKTGHEHLSGSVVVPLFDAEGRVVQLYGRKIGDGLRKGTALHLYLPGPQRGVFNREALTASKEIILCESLFDALTFWAAGHRHVTSSYGAGGLTGELREAFALAKTERVLVAFDRDPAGDRGADKVAAELSALGIEVMRVLFPRGMDANAYALEVPPAEVPTAEGGLQAALRSAVWLAGKRPLARPSQPNALPPAAAEKRAAAKKEDETAAKSAKAVATTASPETAPPSLAASEANASSRIATSTAANTAPAVTSLEPGGELTFVYGDRRWRIRLQKSATRTELRINALVGREGLGFHVDTLELYSARQRAAFTKTAADELAVEEHAIKRDLGAILLELERLQEEACAANATPNKGAAEMSQAEQREALALLRDPKLLERVLADFERLGVVGERTNKLIGYLAATSRKLDEPLAVVIQSSSAAGKSSLMDAVLALVPEEDRVQYSAMTGQSLFYMGEQDLRHKILAIVEEEGAERASYALKLLQSEGELTIASTGKDPESGRLVTHEYRVTGPVMIMLTTTAIDVDEELLNRCLVLTVDEGREQTRAIHARQRRAQTLAGLLEREERAQIQRLHQNAQRLLKPLFVVNAHAERLSFLDHRTRTRRDHVKYLTLIRTIAFLHQHQREVKTVEHRGQPLRYIEVEPRDIELADRLARDVLMRSIDELPPQTRRLLSDIVGMVSEMAERDRCPPTVVRFTRRHLSDRTGWGLTQLKHHLRRLEEHELVLVVGGGGTQRKIYELGCTYDPSSSGSEADSSGSRRGLAGGGGRRVSPNDDATMSELVGAVDLHRSQDNGARRPALDASALQPLAAQPS
jgi:DNA primase catalytic core